MNRRASHTEEREIYLFEVKCVHGITLLAAGAGLGMPCHSVRLAVGKEVFVCSYSLERAGRRASDFRGRVFLSFLRSTAQKWV
ncbi:hypothetical protein BOTBODRAFT_58181 [Botryobasidium botryosum FD-172 SS1]|uniref:Uncharacterized protein n=1 Tax=Botryobasidium botryosum (strain FD-172 SS1) TaxID=930990 RepID=A0A067MEF6_BOTB1|nr:hypothetical protein BOTBODRAFT_58181 [Botryobasidium botryosum FD-172 SS1]